MSTVILVPSRVTSPSIPAARLTLQEALRFTLTVTNVITLDKVYTTMKDMFYLRYSGSKHNQGMQ
jgi:hypothetical protein